jgi:hypothetical protein
MSYSDRPDIRNDVGIYVPVIIVPTIRYGAKEV